MDKLQKLIASGVARGISETLTKEALLDTIRQPERMVGLRRLGYSLDEIAIYFDLTRQRVSQILGPNSGKAVSKQPRTISLSVRNDIWREAAKSPDWWGRNGKLKHKEIVIVFLNKGHSWAKSRELSKLVQGSKLDVVLFASFDVEPNNLAHTAFFNALAANWPKYDILAHINSKQPLQVTKRLFDRRWFELGLQAKKRVYDG